MGDQNDDNISTCTLYVIMAAMMIFGTCNTIVMKAQNEMTCDDWCNTDQPPQDGDTPCGDNGEGTLYVAPNYFHPYFQCANMFVGELCCFIPYFIRKYCFNKKTKTEDNKSEEIYPLSPGTQLA